MSYQAGDRVAVQSELYGMEYETGTYLRSRKYSISSSELYYIAVDGRIPDHFGIEGGFAFEKEEFWLI